MPFLGSRVSQLLKKGTSRRLEMLVPKGQGTHFSSFLAVGIYFISHSVALSLATATFMQSHSPDSGNTSLP